MLGQILLCPPTLKLSDNNEEDPPCHGVRHYENDPLVDRRFRPTDVLLRGERVRFFGARVRIATSSSYSLCTRPPL
jgi:hypothetical protein